MTFGQPRDHQARKRTIAQAAEDLDRRRRQQIQNQIAAINRLLIGGSYTEEMKRLHEQLADAQVRLDEISQIHETAIKEPRTDTRPDRTILFEALVAIRGVLMRRVTP